VALLVLEEYGFLGVDDEGGGLESEVAFDHDVSSVR
jgi:hypothetical protein